MVFIFIHFILSDFPCLFFHPFISRFSSQFGLVEKVSSLQSSAFSYWISFDAHFVTSLLPKVSFRFIFIFLFYISIFIFVLFFVWVAETDVIHCEMLSIQIAWQWYYYYYKTLKFDQDAIAMVVNLKFRSMKLYRSIRSKIDDWSSYEICWIVAVLTLLTVHKYQKNAFNTIVCWMLRKRSKIKEMILANVLHIQEPTNSLLCIRHSIWMNIEQRALYFITYLWICCCLFLALVHSLTDFR